MLALRKTVPAFGAALVDLAEPPGGVPAGHLRLAVAAAGICGSDLHAYEWTPGYEFMAAALPVTIGHEFSGWVTEIGAGVEGVSLGDRVVCWPTVTCGTCANCRRGEPQDCTARRIIGLHQDGGFAERVTVPAANCFALPEGLALDIAALAEPLSIAVNAANLADIGPGDRVAVLGPGPIGMGVAWVAQARGAHVLLAGFDDTARLDRARDLGLNGLADLAREPLGDAVARVLGGAADRVIEATGHAGSVAEGLDVLRPRGILVVAGIHKAPLTLDLTRLVREKKQLRGAHDTTAAALREAIALLAAHGDQLGRMITHREPLERAIEAVTLARSRQAVKVLLLPPQSSETKGLRP